MAMDFPAVKKTMNCRQSHYEIIAASQITWPCLLLPIVNQAATQGVEDLGSLDHYEQFYINKYRIPSDFLFLHTT
ncbi:hypothetical protein FRC10_009482 [Ceratobasidium sp. 414]|nr:hypothetical protein FRC10_009482 [Ceratobasidium sp. 414]